MRVGPWLTNGRKRFLPRTPIGAPSKPKRPLYLMIKQPGDQGMRWLESGRGAAKHGETRFPRAAANNARVKCSAHPAHELGRDRSGGRLLFRSPRGLAGKAVGWSSRAKTRREPQKAGFHLLIPPYLVGGAQYRPGWKSAEP